jgi:Brp/Blh family beta-carotene 15,15'-monooxygenase
MPYFSLFIFFLISFYHFGQSQFSFIQLKEKNLIKIGLYLVWGASIIGGLFYHHYDVLINFFNETSHFSETASIITEQSLLVFFIVNTLLSVLLMGVCLLKVQPDAKRFWTEIGIFFLLHLAFFTLPPLLAFSIYFAIWHSLKVLDEEYVYMKKIGSIKGLKGFVKLLLPYSSISIVGALLIIAGFSYFQFSISPFFLTIIFLSVLTLPHSVVMMNWYRFSKSGSS